VDLARIEEAGCVVGARPDYVSERAKSRQRQEMGTLGSGNHYLEVQAIAEIFDAEAANAFGLVQDEAVVTIHCGSRGLGHQIGGEFLKEMAIAAAGAGIALPDRELACAPIASEIGQRYLGALGAATNCALANREILGHFARRVLRHFFPNARMQLLFDVSHNTCKIETHRVDGKSRLLFVHRKGATRAFGPGHASLPESLRKFGQPVLIGGSMGTGSYVLAGMAGNEDKDFSSACHGAGRAMSRHAARKTWNGRAMIDDLAAQGILIRSPSARGVAEEAPGAYKDIDAVVETTERAGLARRVARLRPLICIKG
jgi:tRNA-splicing ligase RtcB (3'-phosphate/5'-hydroxy nucleic acid ligase)